MTKQPHADIKLILDTVSVIFIIHNKCIISCHDDYLFVLEEAYWYAIDFLGMESIGLKLFAQLVLKYNGLLSDAQSPGLVEELNCIFEELYSFDGPLVQGIGKIIKIDSKSPYKSLCKDYETFKAFKQRILVYGALILSSDLNKVLVVKQAKAGCAFPKGKKNENETGKQCAIREVYEEIGYDISKTITDVKVKIFDKMTFYIVLNGSEDHSYIPQVRNEIDKVYWIEIDKIPNNEKYKIVNTALNQAKGFIKLMKQTNFSFKGLDNILNGTSPKQSNKATVNKNRVLSEKIDRYLGNEDPNTIRTTIELNSSTELPKSTE